MNKILFVSHKEKKCGVHQYGRDVAQALEKSDEYSFVYVECSSAEELFAVVDEVTPLAVIYNYYFSTQPWLQHDVMNRISVPQLGILHEVTQQNADSMTNEFFDYHIAPDPSLLTRNPIVFKTGRLVPEYKNLFELPEVPTIGSFGFATAGKGFRHLMIAVQEEFDEAIIRLHIPSGDFANSSAKEMAQQCQEMIVKDGIQLIVTHDFYDVKQLLDFLAQNTLNAFFYERCEGRGISSVIEKAISVQRPIAVTNSLMFRHVLSSCPAICVQSNAQLRVSPKQRPLLKEKMQRYVGKSQSEFPLEWLVEPQHSLKQIMANGTSCIDAFRHQWNEANLVSDYEKIVNTVLNQKLAVRPQPARRKKALMIKRVYGRIRRIIKNKSF